MTTRTQIEAARPEVVVELARHWATAATTLESAVDDYKGFIDKPGGQYWEGKTAEAAQSRAAEDRKAVIGMADALTKLSTDTVNTMTESVMPALQNVRQLIENVEKKPGFTVHDDLSVSYTAPSGTSEKNAKACQDAVAGMAEQIQDAAETWWQAEQHAADQITTGQKGLTAHFNPLAGLMDPSQELRALQEVTNQAVIDQLAKVKAAKKALDDAMATAYTHGPGDPEGQAAISDLPKLKAEYGRALDDLGNIPDYSNLDPKAMSASADGHFLLGYTADGQPVQVTGLLKNGSGEIFDQAKQMYFTFQDGKLVGSRRMDPGKVTPDDELLFNTVTAVVGAPELAAGVKLGGEAAWQGMKALLGREGLDGAGSGAGALTADNLLPKALASAEARADTASHNLALQHADDIAKPPTSAAGHPSTVEHPAPTTAGEHSTLAGQTDHPAPIVAGEHHLPPVEGPHALPHDSPLFDSYHPTPPGSEFTGTDGHLIYPDDSLPTKPYAVPGTVLPDAHLPQGTALDRFGYPGGSWMSPDGVPFAGRALPPDSASKPYFQYVVDDPAKIPPGYHIEQSQAAPWFQQPGGGVQYRIIGPDGRNAAVQDLLDSGYLREAGKR